MMNEEKKPAAGEKKDVFLLGGKDLEMYQIEKRLRRAGKEFVNRNLEWGAKIDDYNDIVQQILESEETPVAVELGGADKIEGVVDIDHHNEKAGRPASITQVMSRIGKPMSLVDEMIAANDSAYIPGMEAKMQEYRSQLVEKYGEEKFIKLKTKLIELVRAKDRQMQGVTPDMEREAAEAIEKAERGPNGLLIVKVSYGKMSPVTDRLFPTWPEGRENLIVVCKTGEVYYFGPGDICKDLKEKFSGWGGGRGYGKADANGFGGCKTDNQQPVIDFITERNTAIDAGKT
jgi:hypothetical protein